MLQPPHVRPLLYAFVKKIPLFGPCLKTKQRSPVRPPWPILGEGPGRGGCFITRLTPAYRGTRESLPCLPSSSLNLCILWRLAYIQMVVEKAAQIRIWASPFSIQKFQNLLFLSQVSQQACDSMHSKLKQFHSSLLFTLSCSTEQHYFAGWPTYRWWRSFSLLSSNNLQAGLHTDGGGEGLQGRRCLQVWPQL